jgi:phospholipid transport system substrate-binding protein
MRYRTILMLSVAVLAALGGPGGAGAGEATEQLRANIDELYRSVNSAPAPSAAEAAGARAIVDRMFDWTAMAEASLRGHWQRRTAAERTEFTRLFSDLFARAYVSRINLVDAQAFRYLGDATAGDRGKVRTKVVTKRGSTLDVDYVVHATPARRWQVQDVQVESISLIANYRAQFDSIISRSSYEELVTRLRTAGR